MQDDGARMARDRVPLQHFLRLIQGGRRVASRASAETNDDLIANLKSIGVISRSAHMHSHHCIAHSHVVSSFVLSL